MMKNANRLSVPQSEKKFISPELRQKLFLEIKNGYKTRFNMKPIFSCLNTNPEIYVDYLVVYTVRNDMDTMDLVLFDIPPIYSDRSTPCYKYYRKMKKEDQFFQYGVEDMTTLDRNRFYEYIVKQVGLSLEKDDPLYWKNPDNISELLPWLLDLSLHYNKKPNKKE